MLALLLVEKSFEIWLWSLHLPLNESIRVLSLAKNSSEYFLALVSSGDVVALKDLQVL